MLQLASISYQGPPFSEASVVVPRLPPVLAALLRDVNGFVQFGGGLHVRGICAAPTWHSLEEVWLGRLAIHRHYPAVLESDVPFAQDCVADQFFLRSDVVFKLFAETGEIESLDLGLLEFLRSAQDDPAIYLDMQPLLELQRLGGRLVPGEVVHVYPPFCTAESAEGVSVRAVPIPEALSFLADFASQIGGLSDGAMFKVQVIP